MDKGRSVVLGRKTWSRMPHTRASSQIQIRSYLLFPITPDYRLDWMVGRLLIFKDKGPFATLSGSVMAVYSVLIASDTVDRNSNRLPKNQDGHFLAD